MKKLVIFFFCTVLSLVLQAHQDTPIKLEDDGSLTGLPEQYSNPTFDLNTLTLCIGENKIIVPECVKDVFTNDQINLNHIYASWYHDPEILPYYIHIDINGYQIFFNLETLEIFQIWRSEILIENKRKNKLIINEQELSEECQVEILKSITKR